MLQTEQLLDTVEGINSLQHLSTTRQRDDNVFYLCCCVLTPGTNNNAQPMSRSRTYVRVID
jgi:hypothetical protein